MLVDLRDFGLIWQRKVNFHSVSRGVFVSVLMCDFHWFFHCFSLRLADFTLLVWQRP